MPIRDNQRVKKGDLLFRIDPRPYQAMLDDAKARLTTLDAQIMLTQRTIKAQEYNAQSVSAAVERAKALVKQTTSSRIRLEPLVPQGFASQEDLDQARTAEKAARAELEATLLQAKQASAAVTGVDAMVAQRAGILAQIALAELHLEFTEVRAPFNGVVVALKTTIGQYASALKPVFTLLDDDHWYVVANFRETDLQNVRPGVPARITVMTNHGRTFEGVVDSVGTGVLPDGGSVIEGLPVIQKSINWVHVSQRFPVKISVILFFCAIYLMRVLGKLGLAFFVVALAVIYAQTFPSMTSQSEILVRLLLWLWVAINTAILVTLLVNACFQQAFPGYQFKARLVVMLRQTAKVLSQPDEGEPQPTFTEIAGQFNQLQSLYQQAARATPEIAASPQAWQSLMAAALRCYHLTALLQPGDDHPDARRRRIAYAGIQIGFTFALAFLSWFGPLSNLTELRDRVIGILLGVLVSSIVHLYLWPDSEAPRLKARLAQLYRQLAQTLAARDDEVQLVPLFAALTESETLINRVSTEPLGTYAHPWPEAKNWPTRASFRQAEEILRLSEGYRLYAAPGDTFLARCAPRLEDYAAGLDAQQIAAERSQALLPDPANPFGAPLVNALAALPTWPFASSVIPRQATRS